MNEIECETCIKRKTKYCPNSSECYETIDKPYYQNRIMLLEENWKLKKQLSNSRQIKNQQKEFIEWLEGKLSNELGIFTEIRVCDVLSKYKEIIGDK